MICRDRSVGKPPGCVFKKMLPPVSGTRVKRHRGEPGTESPVLYVPVVCSKKTLPQVFLNQYCTVSVLVTTPQESASRCEVSDCTHDFVSEDTTCKRTVLGLPAPHASLALRFSPLVGQ